MKLTERQKAFCDYYIETLNATESYQRAGYKVKSEKVARANASRLLANANVRKYIEERMAQKNKERIASQDEVLEFLTRVMRGEETEETVVVENKGDFISEAKIVKKQVAAKERVKAAELLGKRYMLFTDKVDVSGNLGVVIVDDIEEDENGNSEG